MSDCKHRKLVPLSLDNLQTYTVCKDCRKAISAADAIKLLNDRCDELAIEIENLKKTTDGRKNTRRS